MNLKRYLTLGAASILLIGSFFLPNAAAGITDSRWINNLEMIDSQSISFEATPDLGLPDKIALIANSGTETMPLSTGNIMDEEIAGNRAILELTRFFKGSSYSFEFRTCTVTECAAAFAIDMATPSLNTIIWELTLSDAQDNQAMLTIDDETGVILKIIYRQAAKNQNSNAANNASQASPSDLELRSGAMALSRLMRDYYNMQITLGDYHYNGALSYYRADLATTGKIIPMFGVVRVTGFTMNEKV